jgi:hypothetical protein
MITIRQRRIGNIQLRLVERPHPKYPIFPPMYNFVANWVGQSNVVAIGLCPTYSPSRAVLLFEQRCAEQAKIQGIQ